MASVFRKKAKGKELPHYYCTFQVPDGDGTKQVHRSTRKTNRREAMEVAIRLEAEARNATFADDSTAKAVHLLIREAGELALAGRLTPMKGREFIGRMMAATGAENTHDFTLREWTAEWIKEKEATTKPSTAQHYRTTAEQFLNHLQERADSPLDLITVKDVRTFRDSFIENGRAAKTANHRLKTVRSLFGDAIKASALLHNPAAAIKPLPEKDTVHREPFTAEEVHRLVEAAPSGDWKGVILVGAFTGLRLLDATRLTIANLDLEKNIIRTTPRKTDSKGTTVEIPLHPDLRSFLEDHERSPFPKAPLFPTLCKFNSGQRGGLSEQFTAIMNTAGIDRGLVTTTKDGSARARNSSTKSFHSLRHTFTSMLAKANVPEEIRMKMTGHTDSRTHQKYTHQELSALRASVESIPSLKLS